MRNDRFIKALMYILVTLTLILTSCGGEGGGAPPNHSAAGRAGGTIGISGRTVVLRTISITPSTPLGINSGTQLQFAATGSYSDNSVQDITKLVLWVSSDPSVATVSNEAASMGLATAVSKGYCSISATLDGVSISTIMGIN